MAVLYGKLHFPWVQHSRLCIPELTRILAASNWQPALSKTNPRSALIRVYRRLSAVRVFSVSFFSVPPCLRGGLFFACQNGERA